MVEYMLMVDPSGESGFVRLRDVPKAFSQGYQRGYKLRAPNGQVIVAPLDFVDGYLRAGCSIIPDNPEKSSE